MLVVVVVVVVSVSVFSVVAVVFVRFVAAAWLFLRSWKLGRFKWRSSVYVVVVSVVGGVVSLLLVSQSVS